MKEGKIVTGGQLRIYCAQNNLRAFVKTDSENGCWVPIDLMSSDLNPEKFRVWERINDNLIYLKCIS